MQTKMRFELVFATLVLIFVFIFIWISSQVYQVDLIGVSDLSLSQVYKTNRIPNDKLLCLVLSINTTSSKEKSDAVSKTWGRRCNKLLIVESGKIYNETSDGFLTVPLLKESREQLWHKVILSLLYAHRNYLNEFDWFLKADDDTFVLVDKLKQFLSEQNKQIPIYFGHKFKPYVKQGYMSGGAGYVLNQRALRLLVERGFQMRREECHLNEGQVEDVEIGLCLEAVGVRAGDSRDSLGRPKFLALPPQSLLNENWSNNKDFWYYSYEFYGPPKAGKDCCSSEPISFHYISPQLMYFIDWILYDVKLTPNNNDDTNIN